jgi:hypothetical protein
MGGAAVAVYGRAMALSRLQRPSVLVGAWTVVVVGVFVVRGDLRIASEADRQMPSTSAQQPAAPQVVRAHRAPRPAPTTTHRGRIFDALGFLVAGAEILVGDRAPLRSDGDGAFGIELAAGDAADLLVRGDGMQPTWLRASDGSPDPLVVQLVPAAPWDPAPPPPAPLPALRGEGLALDEGGRPLAFAFVTAEGTGAWARADEFGRFAAALPGPVGVLRAHLPEGGGNGMGFAGRSEPIAVARERGAMPVPDLHLGPATGVRGIVRDARGHPIVGVPVVAIGEGLRRVAETGSGGAFRIGGLPIGSYRVQPFPWRGAVGMAVDIQLDDEPVDVDLHLHLATEAKLRVVDDVGGAVAGVLVAVSIGGQRRAIGRTDFDGVVDVPIAPDAQFEVRTSGTFAAIAVQRFVSDPPLLVVSRP